MLLLGVFVEDCVALLCCLAVVLAAAGVYFWNVKGFVLRLCRFFGIF